MRRLGALLRAHWLFAALVTAGAGLRAIAFLAYRPALFYPDSFWYLANAEELVPKQRKPIGYAAFLDLFPDAERLALVPLVQHLLGLAVAVLLYVLLTRLGVWRWVAALAIAPLLLDAFQLSIEQHILSETPFELLLVGACALLLWRTPLTSGPAALAGVLLAGAVLVRPIGLASIGPALLAVVLFAEARPSRAVVAGVLAAGFVLPLGAYAVWYHDRNDDWGITGSSARFIYARVAPFADCGRDDIPAAERPLCPDRPLYRDWVPHRFAWDAQSPWFRVRPADREVLAASFSKRVLAGQPLDYLGAVAGDLVHGYAWKRSMPGRKVPFERRFLFQEEFPHPNRSRRVIRAAGGDRGRVRPQLVSVLRAYQELAYTPGPLLAIGVLGGLAAAIGFGRVRERRLRMAALLFATLGFALALFPAATHHLSTRYQLPPIALLPPAIAIAARAFRPPAGDRADTQARPAAAPPRSEPAAAAAP